MSEENYNKCIINNGTAGDLILNANEGNSESVDLKKFSELLDTVLTESDVRHERELAVKAKHFADRKEKGKLRELIASNLSSFVSGTFATLAGGALLEMIKALLI